jgi:phosphodiesterase/alkaline phosphatase D-like protein
MNRLVLALILSLAVSIFAVGQTPQNPTQSQNLQIINGPVVERTGPHGAVIAWTTNVGGSSVVHYGTDANNLNQTAQAPYRNNQNQPNQTHRVRIHNLQPGTTYYFVVDSGEGFGTGTQAKSQVAQFTTAQPGQSGNNAGQGNGQALQIIHGPVVEDAGNNYAVVAWTTNDGSSSFVHYGTDRNNLSQTAQTDYVDSDKGSQHGQLNPATHRVRIDNLQPGTTYFFIVDSTDGDNTTGEAKSAVAQFATKK